ncbi:translation elongation factor Ts [Luteibacter rhizovicinus DSM 16549]|uniref:Elongation factor Ts n=1 Tax=Luteibacter rhizovicinus DSM 16549 TaxID=1440763 RepID=A0A0G9HDL1_9GAMM|nr:translation elongation factor Ts [Luteibacter rhizovicinus]APG02845.1 translation elongation factor Ts [Luteibacter rhizovicinus DSM 16549]KLD65802.1 elongation factor Ts [Luteibacter rhizovicinus DSM 16549]KLD79765.1 elongation factor Ts [Xanthomonas hyacinthi DSM 19077]
MADISAKLVNELRQRSGVGMMECKKALVENNGDIEVAMEWLRKNGMAKADKKADRVAAEGLIAVAQKAGVATLVEVNSETDFSSRNEQFIQFTKDVANVALQTGINDIEALKAAKLGENTVEEGAKTLTVTIGEKFDVRRMAKVESEGTIGAYSHSGRIGVLVALKGGSEELAKGIAMHVAAMNPKFIKVDDVPADFLAKEKEIELSKMTDKDKAKPADILDKIISGKVNKILAEVTLVGQPYVLDGDITVAEALKKGGAEIVSVQRLAVGEGIEKVVDDFAAEVMKQAGLA